jgi:predicted nucleotidyltransferase component of viral defense system
VVALVLLVVVLNAIAVMISTNLDHSSANAQDVSEDMCLLLSAKVHYAWFPFTIKSHYSLPKKEKVDYYIN